MFWGDAADSEANAREALVAKVRGYNEELYLDALTGAYNRRYYEDRIRKSEKVMQELQ